MSDTSPGHRLLLLSGGHDSIALAAWMRPEGCLTINYGQRPVAGEMRASEAVTRALNIPWHILAIDLTPVGSGLMHDPGEADSVAGTVPPGSPSAEWWPFRNQLLVSLASAWALPRRFTELIIGSVAPDGARHRDGTADFYERLDSVVAFQEGGLRITAPAIGLTTVELIARSGVSDDVLAFAHSCHLSEYSCGVCPGCRKHEDVLRGTGRFQ